MKPFAQYLAKWSLARRTEGIIGYGAPIIAVQTDLAPLELCQAYFDCYAVVPDPGRLQAKVPLFTFYLLGDGAILHHIRRAKAVIANGYDPVVALLSDGIYVNCGERHAGDRVLTRTGTPWLLPLNLILFALNLPLWGGKAVYFHATAGAPNRKSVPGVRKPPVRRRSHGRILRTIQGQRLDQRKAVHHGPVPRR